MARPTDYREDFHCESVIELSKEGKTIAEICAEWDIAKQTFYTWAKTHSKFLDAIKKAEAHRESYYINDGRKLYNGGLKGNPTPWIFIMKNCFDWSDKKQVSVSGEFEFDFEFEDDEE